MCGIVGELSIQGSAPDRAVIEAMRDRLQHRGPDDVGYFEDGSVRLGFRRLAIIDLSPAGHQPMSTPDKRYTIIFNGEIYNYLELRQALVDQGYVLHSKTDTEVILALYQKYDLDFVQHLRGMFALALWDAKRERLVLARDRLGKKPLKYFIDSRGIIFASELKALLEHPRVPRQADPEAIHHYLSLQYVPAPLTGFVGIRKLPPAHLAVMEKGQLTITKYWDLRYNKTVQRSPQEWVERIRQELETSVRLRMMSDVPLGAFLSGGIDSSAVVAMMAKHSSRPVKTFSIGFKEQKYNELPYAKMIAEKFQTDHTEFVVEPQTIDILPKLAWQYEEPFADSSGLPTYILSQLTRQHVTVALNGDGGDENFAGYERYPIFALAERLNRLPRSVRHAMSAGSRALRAVYTSTLTDRGARFTASLLQPSARRYLEYMQYFSDEYKRQQYTSAFSDAIAKAPASWELIDRVFQESQTENAVHRAMYADIHTYLPDDLLVKVDIASMAWSLEGRSPLLDHLFMEMTATIPSSLKVRGQQKKIIFRQALRGIIPDEILDRPKQGFGVPIEHWFRGELKGFIRERLLDGRFHARQILQPQAVEELVERHSRGRVSYAYQLWSLLMLELWYEQYFD